MATSIDKRIACKYLLSFLSITLLSSWPIHGQPKCKVEFYSTEQGLSHQAVTSILKDKEGFMWFGSWDGINRFDGHKFVSYKSSPGDASQLKNDRIDRIVEDETNHLWVQAYDRQVYRFDKKTERFFPLSNLFDSTHRQKAAFTNILAASGGWLWLQSVQDGVYCVSQTDTTEGTVMKYNKDASTERRLPSNKLNFFHEDRERRIWIATPDGLCYLQKNPASKIANYTVVVPAAVARLDVRSYDEDIAHLYFGTADGQLISFDKKTGTFSFQQVSTSTIHAVLLSKKSAVLYATTGSGEILTIHSRNKTIVKANYKTKESLRSIYEDRTGILWIEPEHIGVIRFDPVNQSFQTYAKKIEDPNYGIGNRFNVFEDNTGLVWVNHKGGGFGYYNPTSAKMEYSVIVANDGSFYQLPAIVFVNYYDSTGVLWLRVYGRELIKLIFQRNDFTQKRLEENSLLYAAGEVRGVLCDRRNRLWLGAKSGRLYVQQNGKPVTGLFVNEPPQGLGQVYTMLEDSKGNIWMGTKRNGLFKAAPLNKAATKYKLTNYLANENDVYSITSNQVYSLLEDRQGRIWIGTFDNRLNLVDDSGDRLRFIHTGKAFQNYPKTGFEKIRHMALDSAGNIWIATTNGLLLLEANNEHPGGYRYKAYSKIPGDKTSLGNNDVQFIHRDAKSRMWLATSGGGLCEAIGKAPFQALRFRNYTTENGLPNDYVLSCTEDEQGNLWLSTENGLSKFNPATGVFRNYDSFDGLPKLGFSEAAVSRQDLYGNLVFGTTDGYLLFNPKNINVSPIASNIVFTNLQINNQTVGPHAEHSPLTANINYVSDLTLKHDQNIVSIDYAILDYRTSDRQAFAYRLVGFDTTWHDDRQQRRVTYTNLPPGKYLFEVKNISADLYANKPYRQLSITILPPWWKTWWAYVLYTVLLALIVYFIWRYAVAMIRLRNEVAVEQKLAALKMNFFTNVSHELRTPLTLIVNPLDEVANKGELSPQMSSYIEVARKNAGRMLRFINQLLDLRKIQSDKATLRVSRVEMVSFVKKICDYFTEAARVKGLKLEFAASEKTIIAWVDTDKLDVVIYNLLGNAVKFTKEGGTITVFLKCFPDTNQFTIAVHDQGPGVPKEELEDIFELFHGGEHTGETKGTGIGLALSKEFVHLHAGTIRAENNSDGGLTVTVQLNLGSAHCVQDDVSFVDTIPLIPHFDEMPLKERLLETVSGMTSPHADEKPRVLLVEDNDELRLFIKSQLSEFYQVVVAKDGEEGFEKALHLLPDLIVSDIMMPKLDGIQMLDKIKNDVTTSHIPLVLLSAKYSIESQIEGLQYGADAYITKPFHNAFLIASIDNLIRQRKKLFESLLQKNKTVAFAPGPVAMTSKDEQFLKEVIKAVEEKMAAPEFSVESLAGTMAMNSNTFYKKFKSLAGLTPVEFVRDMRLQRAKQLFDAGGDNVSEVAYETGFSNPKYFSTCFKEKFGISPSDYLRTKTV